jgi:predicted secreted protein
MADPEYNGTDILLLVASGASYIAVASQRNVTFTETTAAIDLSSKASRAFKGKPGRYKAVATCEALYFPTASGYVQLRAAMRAGTMIMVQKSLSGAAVEAAECIVTSLGEAGPDQGPATVSANLEVNGVWATV